MLFKGCKIYILFILLLSGVSARSQSEGFTMSFASDKVETNGSDVIEVRVKIVNTSSNILEGQFEVHSNHEDIYMSQRKPKQITLQAKDSIFVSVKAIVSSSAKAGNQSTIEAILTLGSNQSKNIAIPVIIHERKLVKVMFPELNIIYENAGDSLSVPVHIFNEGNTTQKIAILARYPNFIARNTLENKTVDVRAFTDTIIYLKKGINKNILKQEDFDINITTLYHNGNIISSGLIKASSIKSNRRYTAPYNSDYNLTFRQENQITASTQFNNDASRAYFLYANAQVELKNAIIQSNVDLNYWENSEQLFLRNTWVAYKEKKYGATVGSISKFSDFNLMGRGAELYYKPDDKNLIEAGAVDKSYNLIDDTALSFGKSAWTSFTHNGGWMQKKGYEAMAIYDNDSYYGVDNYLASARFAIFNSENFNLRAGGAVSNVTSNSGFDSQAGGSGEIQLNGKVKSFYYSSSNYLSSAYFSGMRRGVINLNERVNIPVGKFNIWTAFNYLSVEPKIYANQYGVSNFSSLRYDVGVSTRAGSLLFTFAPYLYKEQRMEQLFTAGLPKNYELDAIRLNLGMGYYNMPTKQNVTLSVEGGKFTTNTFIGEQYHFKANAIYNWKMLSLFTFYQYNNFYLGEIIANVQSGKTEKYTNLTISPTIQQKFFNNKLSVTAGMTYSDNSLVAESLQFNGRVEYNMTSDFTLFFYNYYSDFSTSPQPMNTFQVGLTKRFNAIKADTSKSDLEIYVYYEPGGKLNLENSKPAAGQLVIINGKAFRANGKGIIIYKSLPPGDYTVKTLNTNEWYASERTIEMNSDTKITIGLTRTATIKGSLSYIATEKSFDITRRKNGLSVIAIDDSGKVFTTKTDDNGNFTLYVPKGIYTVTLEKSGISEYVDIENNNTQVDAEPNDIKEVKFDLIIKEKRVETKKFSSRGFPAPAKADDKKK